MSVSIKELVKNLESVPVYQRKNAEVAYSGQKVVWELNFKSIRDRKENLHVVLSFGPDSYPWVYFQISLDEYPEFKLLHSNNKIIVTATIDSVSGPDVNLKNIEKIEFVTNSGVLNKSKDTISSVKNEVPKTESVKLTNSDSFFQKVILHKHYSLLIVFIFILVIYLKFGVSPKDLIP